MASVFNISDRNQHSKTSAVDILMRWTVRVGRIGGPPPEPGGHTPGLRLHQGDFGWAHYSTSEQSTYIATLGDDLIHKIYLASPYLIFWIPHDSVRPPRLHNKSN